MQGIPLIVVVGIVWLLFAFWVSFLLTDAMNNKRLLEEKLGLRPKRGRGRPRKNAVR